MFKGIIKEQQGGHYRCRVVSDQGEEGGDEVREVVGASCQGLVGTMKNLGLFCVMQATGDL